MKPEDFQNVVEFLLLKLPNALGIYAFGSRIHGTPNANSDLDLAVLVEGYVVPLQLFDLASTLSELVDCPVDLLDFRAASTVMQFQILTTGLRLWAKDVRAGLFEAAVLTEKHHFDFSRKELLQDIQNRGSVYG